MLHPGEPIASDHLSQENPDDWNATGDTDELDNGDSEEKQRSRQSEGMWHGSDLVRVAVGQGVEVGEEALRQGMHIDFDLPHCRPESVV